MQVADLVLPVFAIIVTGWLAGWLGYISRSLADGLVHFAYNVAMPALLFVTIAQEPARNLLEWRFLLAFGGGSIVCFAAGLCGGTHGVGTRPRQQHDLWNGSGDDQYWLCGAANPTLHLRTAGRSASRRRNGVRRRGDVPHDGYFAGKRGTRRRDGRSDGAGEADRTQSDGAIDPDRSGMDDRGPADAGRSRGVYEHLRGCAHAMCPLRHRPGSVGRGNTLEPHSDDFAYGRQTPDHASHCLRAMSGVWSQSALHDRRSHLCRRADRQNRVHPGWRVQGRRTSGRSHGLDHNAGVGRDVDGLDLRPRVTGRFKNAIRHLANLKSVRTIIPIAGGPSRRA